MAKCPNCNKEIAFFLAYCKGVIPVPMCGARTHICKDCGASSRPVSKSSSIFVLGMTLTILVGFGLSRIITLDKSFWIYGIFVWFLIIWPYVWWKTIAKLEIRLKE